MPLFKITDAVTNNNLGLFSATNESDALNMMARAHGCAAYALSSFFTPSSRRSLRVEVIRSITEEDAKAKPVSPSEELRAAAGWLSLQPAALSTGLRSAEDALALWRGWKRNRLAPDQLDPEYAKIPQSELAKQQTILFDTVLGYSPYAPK